MSTVDKRFTITPKGKTVCGAFKGGELRHERELSGITPEQILNNEDLYYKFVCTLPPGGTNNNGRCRFHGGSAGRKPVTGKNSKKKFLEIPEEHLITKHNSLNPELELLTKLIEKKKDGDAPEVMTEEIVKHIKELDKVFSSGNMVGVAALITAIKGCLRTRKELQSNERELVELIKEYSKVFAIESNRRSNLQNYMLKKDVLNFVAMLFGTIVKIATDHINDEYMRKKVIDGVRNELYKRISVIDGEGTDNKLPSTDTIGRPENSDETPAIATSNL